MPRNIIYPVAILAILGPGGAHGDMRCIKLNAATVCTASTDCYNTSDCRVTCAGVAVDLAGRCSSDSGTENISIADNISLGAGTKLLLVRDAAARDIQMGYAVPIPRHGGLYQELCPRVPQRVYF